MIGLCTSTTKTYSELANLLGKPKSARAVANACGKNPYVPIIPCHRVIRSDGYLGGYSGDGGIEMKKELLKKTTPIALVAICLSAGCVTANSYGNFPVTEKSYSGSKKDSTSYTGQMARHVLHNSLKKLSG